MFARLLQHNARVISRPLAVAPVTRRVVPAISLGRSHYRRFHHTDTNPPARDVFAPLDTFPRRHLGSEPAEIHAMLQQIGAKDMEELVAKTIPSAIRSPKSLALKDGFPERELLHRLKAIASKNKVYRSYLGLGYAGTVVPSVILRNVMENPAWYTQVSTPFILILGGKEEKEREGK